MKDNIISKLKEFETEYAIKILYACEAGSRAWGLHSSKSDYDVRFIYVHPPSYYLSIDPVGVGKKKDVMEFPITHSLDLQSFELTKALRLFRKSNPNLLEWLHSKVIYYKAFHTIDKMLEIEPTIFQVKSCIHHYMNMAKRNFRTIEEQNIKDVKRYIQVIRPILISKWILRYQAFPDMEIFTLLEKSIKPSPEQEAISSLFDAKRKQQDFRASYLHSFMKREIELLERSLDKLTTKDVQPITKKLDEIFQETLKECWS